MANEKNWLHYYKNSLTDSENLAIDINRIKNLYEEKTCFIGNGTINAKHATEMLDAEERRINRLKGISKKDSANWREITETEILIAPFYLEYFSENISHQNKTIRPFWIPAKVNRSGQLSTSKALFPLIVRNYLAPIADAQNDFIFSSTEKIINAREIEEPLTEDEEIPVPWDEYWVYINEVFKNITYRNIQNYRTENYQTIPEVMYFATSSKIATAKSILFLYDNILDEVEELPLLSKIISPNKRDRKNAITDQGFLSYNHFHTGQMSNQFPLSISQRKTLLSYLTSEENAVTAVNGPPGTGKTTLLQSVVATEFVKSAIIGEEAPVILACSSNNQAVTNIIDSFINSESSLKELSARWIPDFNGYATYLPSNSKSPKSLENINFLKGNLFGHEGTLCELENKQYVSEAETYFFNRFKDYYEFEPESLEDTCNHLQQEITLIEDELVNGTRICTDYINSIDQINAILIHDKDKIEKDKIHILNLKEWRNQIDKLKKEAKNADFIEKVKKIFFDDKTSKNPKDHSFKIATDILGDENKTLEFIKDVLANLNLAMQSNIKLNDWKQINNIKGYPFVSEAQMWDFEYQKMNTNSRTHQYFYDELDIGLRHKAFLLATHYWEARWLEATKEAIENNTEKGTGEKAISEKWKRRAMLTPCFVATFYMAPPHFIYSQFQGENEEGKPIFEYLPLFNFIDLLIVDEAGQVTPEVSIPLFSLAKKAIVVGDLQQIEPIWSIPQKIDQGNLINQNIIANPNQTELLNDLGFLASNGSIMKMAQNACEFKTLLPTGNQPGMVLLEHRRCNDEIINFCNELAYGGILKPMKGSASEDQIFPSMLAYHIEGVSERKYNSRCNLNEVNAIIKWLRQNEETIQEAYEVNSIEKVLGIITPFASQKNELSKALIEAGYNINDIKLGTVHALQGAERDIVLFSSVYSNLDEGTLFFDKDDKPNMLNVAVSRAKDSFILFGDTRVFDETKQTPSGILKKHLNVLEMVT
ncbi:DEAD/DEAH box helicase [Wenyingzhuangia marina]|uniref:AAA domain-containing protein n=1 Tax=Wenyingzhuangia marina TaxID=1195760 RepID=A0A1M5TV67_9FLAO|nr:DEAD/DEAH box helicase [Wenyingzhuangia marina]GGF70842.1 DNA helicase [Wenyingzhuangia marina]SHH54682.1 AAA domain-containing protein [Wenyingzhuangia marina]